ncbi:MAG: hypothetical protein WAK90_13585, partial [Pseudolabrys sp.]
MPVTHWTKRRSRSRSIGSGGKREVDVDAFAPADREIVDRKRRAARALGSILSKVKAVVAVSTAPDLGCEHLSRPRGTADNLKKLPSLSPSIEKQLNGLGIFYYSQIAAFDEKAAYNLGLEVGLPGRVSGWIDKAKELTAFCPEYKNGIAKLNQRDGLK